MALDTFRGAFYYYQNSCMKYDWAYRSLSAIVFFLFAIPANMPAQSPASLSIHSRPIFTALLPTLTRVEQIRNLSLPEAQRHYPVELRGVVLDYSTLPQLYVSDGTNSIYVRTKTNQVFSQGQELEIEGVSDAGRFAPVVVPEMIRVLGQGTLPEPMDVSFQRIAGGAEDSQWIRISGIVRATAKRVIVGKSGRLTCPELTLVTPDGGRLRVLLNHSQGARVNTLVDADVVVTGIAESIYNGKRQLINVRLLAPGSKFLKIRRPPPPDIWSTGPHPIDSLRLFSPDKPSDHRVKVQGTVTFQQPGQFIYITDGTGSIRVECRQTNSLPLGEQIEVLGFPAVYNDTPVVEDAVFRDLHSRAPAAPLEINAQEAERRDHDGDLISVSAQLLYQSRTPDQLILILQDGDVLFRARLLQAAAMDVGVRDGAQLQVTGICQAEFENDHSPRAFHVLLRSPADVRVLREPSWWTTRRLRWALGVATGVLLASGIWVRMLRRQVTIQTRAIGKKIEREAVLQERMRIAREFHDNLEQELAGVKMQLELTAATIANAPETAQTSLQMAKSMICHSQAEARRSVWELRSEILENNTLPAALSATAHSVDSAAPIDVNISGTTRPLPMRVESNLLRIAQEAITNAIKHAKPRRISVNLAYETDGARLRISDDGCGFSVENAPNGRAGHFGLLGMKERVDKIAGSLHVTSAPGKGACIEVFVPQTINNAKSDIDEQENPGIDRG